MALLSMHADDAARGLAAFRTAAAAPVALDAQARGRGRERGVARALRPAHCWGRVFLGGITLPG